MPLSRLIILAGLIFFGAMAVFMGLAVTVSALSNGSISYSLGEGKDLITKTVLLADDPGTFWTRVTLIGFLPIVLGAASIFWGRRVMRR